MNIKNYISSGILEAYVLGELSEIEKKAVELNAREYPEVYNEIKHIKKVFNEIAIQSQKHASSVPGSIKPAVNSVKTEKKIPQDKSLKKRTFKKSKFPVLGFLAAFAAFMVLITTFSAADFYLKWKNSQAMIDQLLTEKELLLRSASDYQETMADADNSFLFTSDFNRIDLFGLANAPDAHVILFSSRDSEELYLNVENIPKPSEGMQYQLWAVKDNAASDAGLIPIDMSEEYILMNEGKNASSFMVTLEPIGGSKFPDYNNQIAYGNSEEL
jgi:anti-sigma-K factor RskA